MTLSFSLSLTTSHWNLSRLATFHYFSVPLTTIEDQPLILAIFAFCYSLSLPLATPHICYNFIHHLTFSHFLSHHFPPLFIKYTWKMTICFIWAVNCSQKIKVKIRLVNDKQSWRHEYFVGNCDRHEICVISFRNHTDFTICIN